MSGAFGVSSSTIRDFFTPRNVAKNVAIIGIGAYLMVKYDEYFANHTPRAVSRLVKEAAAQFDRDPALARSKLKEANMLLQSYSVSVTTPPKSGKGEDVGTAWQSTASKLFRFPGHVLSEREANSLRASRFTIHFFMGLSYENSLATSSNSSSSSHNAGLKKLSLDCYRRAANELKDVSDFTVFGNVTRKRMGIAFDRLAQQYQDEGNYGKAMECYNKALEALGEPEESRESLAQRRVVGELAGVLNNMSTLLFEIGHEEAGKSVAKRSQELIDVR